MPGTKVKVRPKKRVAGKKGRRLRAVIWRPRVMPGRGARTARRPAAAKRRVVRKPVRRAVRRATAKIAINRAALARIRLAAAVGAVERAGARAGKALRDTQAAAAREAVTAIKAAEQGIEAALPHSGDRTEEE